MMSQYDCAEIATIFRMIKMGGQTAGKVLIELRILSISMAQFVTLR